MRWPPMLPAPLERSTVDLWRVPLPNTPSEEPVSTEPAASDPLLDPTQQQRAASLIRPLDRQRFRAANRALRQIVGHYTGIAPADLVWEIGPRGKPRLADPPPSGLEFNLSHSGSWAVVAVGVGPVGVDVERQRPMVQLDRLLARWCTPGERARLRGIDEPHRTREFLRCWTTKEALLKAIGCGLHVDAGQIETPECQGTSFTPLQVPATISGLPWQVTWFEVDREHRGAVVTTPQIEALRQATWPGS